MRFLNLDLFDVLVRALVLLTCLPIHECAHAWVAHKLGDHTGRNFGRISLNPMVHLDLWGSVLMLISGFGWAKPVPVNTRYFKKIKRDMALTAIAGPAANILLSFVLMLIFKLFYRFGMSLAAFNAIVNILIMMVSINVGLAVFNLLPVPPLDGSRLVAALLPSKIYFKIFEYERHIVVGIFLLLVTGVLDFPLLYLRSWVLFGLDFLTGFLGRIY